MQRKAIAAAAILCVACLSAANAAVVTIRATGTIEYGYDNANQFGAAGLDLSGKAFTQSISGDIAQMQRYTAAEYDYGYTNNAGVAMTVSTTVDGHTASFTLENAQDSYLYLARYLSATGYIDYYPDQIYSRTSGNIGTDFLSTEISGYTYTTAFIGTRGITDSISYAPQNSDASYASFYYGNNSTGQQTYLQVNGLSLVELNPDADVPEPASLGLFAAGLLAAATVRRRKRA